MKVEVNPGPTDAHTILDVPSFNFDDQQYEQLGTPFVLRPETTSGSPAPTTPGCANSCRS
ncbi:hypothetical protein AB0I98_46670 [Streptomyces sp. NPDC050211]|uniref:hypothetical protein n=1 Tax=Streptomyces sp. NPDC050211 TaxID=3154932 RepID=UPI0034465B35